MLPSEAAGDRLPFESVVVAPPIPPDAKAPSPLWACDSVVVPG